MSGLEPYAPREVASAIPDAARAIVEWAHSAEAAYALAQRLVSTTFSPAQYRGKPEDAAAAILSGAEVGLSPMASLRAFDVIQGIAAPRALTIRAIVQAAGHDIVMDEATPTRVRMRGRRRGSTEWQHVEWTIIRATALGLTGKQQWKAQPQTMLIARATTELGRLIAADAILGIGYSVEEIADAEPEPTTTVTRAAEPAGPRKVARRARPAAPTPEEPSFDEPAPAAGLPARPEADVDDPDIVERYAGGITGPQMKKLQASYRDRGLSGPDNRDARLNDASGRLDVEVLSFSYLTSDQASRLIDSLEAPDVEEPPMDGWEG